MGTIHLQSPIYKKKKGVYILRDAPIKKGGVIHLGGTRRVKTKGRKRLEKTTLALTGAAAVLGSVATGMAFPALLPAVGRGALALGKFVAPKSVKSAALYTLGAGALISSPKLRTALVGAPKKIFESGKKLGEIYEDPSKAKDILGIREDMTAKEKIIAGAKSAGKYGALLAGGLAVGALAKKAMPTVKGYLAKRKEDKLMGLKQVGFTEARPVGLGGIPVTTPQVSPLGVSQAPGRALSPQPIHNIIQISVR